jgi:cbb3-type cytochrome oxidase maturation protein
LVNVLLFLIPLCLTLGLTGLAAFLWALRTQQYDDVKGAARRILINSHDVAPPD